MKPLSRTFLIVGLFLGLGAPAAALIPPMIPDICAFGQCVQFTQSTALAQIQSLYQQVTMLANQATNLSSIGNVAHQTITQNIGSVLGDTQTPQPLNVGNAAAQQVAQQAPKAAQAIANVDTLAHSANGTQQQAQVGNLYLSTIAGEAVKSNAAAAQQQIQKQNEASAELAGLQQFASGSVSTTAEQP